MGAMVGVVIGYVLGTRAGERGFEELKESWDTISSSQEVRDMISGGLALAAVMLRQGRGVLAERLQLPEDRGLRVA
jgi:hypothetical protein